MSAAENKKLVQQIYANSASRSGTTFLDNLADDARWVVTGQYSWSHSFNGKDAILNGVQGHFRSLIEGRPRTVAFNFIAEGDYVVAETKGDNLTKIGVRYDNDYCMIWRIEGGKIKEIKEYCELRTGRAGARAIPGVEAAEGGVKDAGYCEQAARAAYVQRTCEQQSATASRRHGRRLSLRDHRLDEMVACL